uniref:TMEM135_C_rich domain-containing protein n=1 Tax=Rhodnius prolixus TaxID=13249 RepID=T1HS67_RHOPR
MSEVIVGSWRRIIGNYNFYTVSFIPSFLSSILSILIERPSRRALLSLYVTNVASETLFRMAVSRKLVKPIRYGEVLIFALSISNLLYFYKGHGLPKDAVYSLLRFLVGPSEEKDYVKQDEQVFLASDQKEINKNHFSLYEQIIQWYKSKILKLKSLSLHSCCPHYHSCVHNAFSSGFQKFVKGYVVQVAIKVIINFKKITKRPNLLFDIPLRMETFNLGLCLGLFATLYRGVSCALRRLLDCDNKLIAFPAGFVAGLSFYFYRDNSIALYFMWKTFQIFYNFAGENGYVPELPLAPVFLHALSTAILFHVAIVEPLNLRTSYWNFLQAMSGG